MSVLRRLLEIAERTPDAPALLHRGVPVASYGELLERVSSLAHALVSRGAGPGIIVGLAMEKSPDWVIGMLAAWWAGAAFVPFDPSLPAERIDRMRKEIGAQMILESAVCDRAEKIAPHDPSPHELAYAIYSSGSTGRPKCVLVEHAGIEPLLDAQIDAFGLGPGHRSLFYLSTMFDAAISDVGTALLSGAALCFEDPASLWPPSALLDTLASRAITYADLPPSILPLIDPEQLPPSLETVVIGGEVCPADVVRRWAKQVRLINVYGPTETTICASMVRCDPEWDRPSIGKPIPGVTFEVIDGELFIGGPCVARGYLDQPELTAQKFCTVRGMRMFRTGDRVRLLPNGAYEFLGRVDRQVKIRGQLVEPEEIEQTLVALPGIREAAVVKRAIQDRDRLVAFVSSEVEIDERDVRRRLAKRLPSFMLPSRVIELDALPRGHTGKIDFERLAAIDLPPSLCTPSEPDERERALCSIFAEALGMEAIGPEDDFFALGGTSLAALQVTAEAARCGIHFPACALIETPSVRALLAGRSIASDSIDTDALRKDAHLDPALKEALSKRRGAPVRPPRSLLLTGATGFLGSRVLRELLDRTDAQIYALVRSSKLAIEDPRIEPIAGDVSLPKLGLDVATWERMCEVDAIFHLAARVNVFLPYRELKPANLDGTREALRLALTGKAKALHYASTLSVCVASDRNTGRFFEEDRLESHARIWGGYAQSKWAAEHLLLSAQEAGFRDLHLYRFGLITGDSETGAGGAHDHLSMFLRGLIALGQAPEEGMDELSVDVTPVDYAARAMVCLALEASPGTHHLANPEPLSLRELVEGVRETGAAIETVDRERWKRLETSETDPDRAAAYLALSRALEPEARDRHRTFDLFQATGVSFDRTHADRALAPANIRCPKADRALVARYVRALSPLASVGLRRADLYDAFLLREDQVPSVIAFVGRLLESYGLDRRGRALDAGCGTGRLLRPLGELGFEVTGLEPDRDYAARARERAGDRAELIVGGFEDLTATDHFDLILTVNGPLYYVLDPERRRAALANLFRALKKGGVLLADITNFLYVLRHYVEPRPATVRIGDVEVTRKSTHRFDFAEALWIHDDEYELRVPVRTDPILFRETYRFAIITPPELASMMKTAGFSDMRAFESWDDAHASGCNRQRIIMSGRKE